MTPSVWHVVAVVGVGAVDVEPPPWSPSYSDAGVDVGCGRQLSVQLYWLYAVSWHTTQGHLAQALRECVCVCDGLVDLFTACSCI